MISIKYKLRVGLSVLERNILKICHKYPLTLIVWCQQGQTSMDTRGHVTHTRWTYEGTKSVCN